MFRVSCLSVALSLALGPARALGGDLAAVRRAGRLLVIASHEIPFEVDVLRGFARAIGTEIRLVVVETREAALAAVAGGRADIAAGGLGAEGEPSPAIASSDEVFPNRTVIVNRRPAAPIQDLEQLRGERVAAARETTAAPALAAAKVPRVDASRPADAVLGALRAGAVSAAAVPLFDALHARNADPEIQLGAFVGPRHSVVFAAREVDTDLLQALNSHLSGLKASTSWRLLISRHFAEFGLGELARAKLSESRP